MQEIEASNEGEKSLTAESEIPFLSKTEIELTTFQTIRIVNSKDNFPTPITKKGKNQYIGVIYTLLSVICLSLNSVILRKYRHIHPFNLGTWSFPISALVTAPLLVHAVYIKKEPVLKHIWPIHKNKKTVFFVWLRASTSSVVVYLLALTIRYISAGDARTIGASSVITINFFGWACLGESCGVVPFIVAIIALLGIGIITRPPLLTGAESFDQDSLTGVLLALVWLSFITTMIITVRYIKQVNFAVLNTFMYFWCFPQSLVLAVLFGAFQVPQDWSDAFAMIMTGVLLSLASTFLVLGLQKEEAGIVALVRTSDVVVTFFWQWVLLGETPDWISIFGASLVLSGVIAVTFRKYIGSLPEDHNTRIRWGFLLK